MTADHRYLIRQFWNIKEDLPNNPKLSTEFNSVIERILDLGIHDKFNGKIPTLHQFDRRNEWKNGWCWKCEKRGDTVDHHCCKYCGMKLEAEHQ